VLACIDRIYIFLGPLDNSVHFFCSLRNAKLIPIYLDVDECAQFPDICHQNANCTNTEGSYSCKCLRGYAGDGLINCSGELKNNP
jgi:hypothetical protein